MQPQVAQLRPARYLLTTVGGTSLVAALIAIALAVFGSPIAWRGFSAALLSAGAALLLSSAIALPLFSKPLPTLMFGLLAAGVFRTAMMGAIVLAAIKSANYPPNATLAIAALLYAGMVVSEGICLWQTFESSNLQPTQDPA